MIAIENVVLQKLHRILVLVFRRIFVAVLLKMEHRAVMDAKAVQGICHQLIRGHALV